MQSKVNKLLSFLMLIAFVLSQTTNDALADFRAKMFKKLSNQECNVFILSIAMGKKLDKNFPQLGACKHDSLDFTEALKKIATKEYQGVFVETLIDEQATKANITSSFGKMAQQARQQDIFILHISGSGTWANGAFYCVPYDCKLADTNATTGGVSFSGSSGAIDSLGTGFLSAAELASYCKNIHADRQLVLLDTCHSADAMPFLVHNSPQPIVFGIQGTTWERENHGIFTGVLLDALQGKADLDRNGLITVRELRDCLSSEYQKAIRTLRHYDSGLIVSLVNRNFVLGSLDSAERGSRSSKISTSQASPSKGTNFALLVATANYDDKSFQQLKNPITDAKQIGQELTAKYGFNVELMENPSRLDLRKKLKELASKSYEPADHLLIYFAGHGTFDGKEGYLVTRDSRSDDELYDSYVSLEGDLKTKIDRCNCKHILLALDTCYGGTFLTDIATTGFKQLRGPSIMDSRPLSEIRAEIEPLTARKFIAAGGKKPVYDGMEHSPLAERMLNLFRQQGGEKRYINFADIESSMQLVQPQGLARTFGMDDPSSDFLLIPKNRQSKESSEYDPDDYIQI